MVLATALLTLGGIAVATSAATPTTTSAAPTQTSQAVDPNLCPAKVTPPPAEDSAEQTSPGKAPAPLAVPASPVGGDQLGSCGFVLPQDAAQLPPATSAASWLIADLDSGNVLAAKDPHARQRPAALVKVLLAMVVLNELKPDTAVLATDDDVETNKDAATIGLVPGKTYTVDQLVKAMLLKAGNDVPHALARQLGGVPKALQKMNALAKQLGAFDTRVVTVTGLDGPGMSTSAYDLALIYRQAMRMPAFAEAETTRSVVLPGVGTVRNDNQLITSYPGAIGGLNSSTTDAHYTNISAASKQGHRLVVIMLRGDQQTSPMYRQGAKLLDYGFSLVDAGTPKVGVLVDKAPEQPTAETSTADQESKAADSSDDVMFAAFGNFGMPLTIIAAIGLLGGLGMYARKRMARARRAAK